MYIDYFGFTADPFQLTPNPKLFFPSSVHNRAKAYLEYGLNQGEGFIVITGEVGAGKTTLVTHLLSALDSEKYVAATIVTSQLGGEEVLRMAAQSFGLKPQSGDKVDLIAQISDFLREKHDDGRRCLLIVDEAQNLSFQALEELRMLSNIQVEDRTPLQSFLVGQPEFRGTMARADLEQLRQRVIASYHLTNVSEDETRGYIEYRLREAGWTSKPTFEDETFAAIYAHTGGIPRKINVLTSRLLLYLYLNDETVITPEIVETVSDDLDQESAMFQPVENAGAASKGDDAIAAKPLLAGSEDMHDLLERLNDMEERVRYLEQTIDSYRDAVRKGLQTAQRSLRKKPRL
ncbi:MAG: XrtA/PEP-CTERM system-associated ATPase [Magnetospiraceae bacterium]